MLGENSQHRPAGWRRTQLLAVRRLRTILRLGWHVSCPVIVVSPSKI